MFEPHWHATLLKTISDFADPKHADSNRDKDLKAANPFDWELLAKMRFHRLDVKRHHHEDECEETGRHQDDVDAEHGVVHP